MKVNFGTYSKNKNKFRKEVPFRRINRREIANKSIESGRRTNLSSGENKPNFFKKNFKFIFIVLILGIAVAGFWRYQSYQSKVVCTEGNTDCSGFSPKDILGSFKPTLKKTDNFTNVLIVGIDTREYDQGLKNTDTIMVASINHEQKKAMLISIPRDIVVRVENEYGNYETRKVNSVYAIGEDSEEGMNILEEHVEDWLGLDIHYSVLVNFQSVKDAVDAMGGVEIEVQDTIPVLYPQDTPPYDYDVYTFEPGVQTMNGETALVWARFRQVYSYRPDALKYGDDFSRAQRQQQVIDALKAKVIADESSTTDKAQKYWKLYQFMSDNIQVSGLSSEDLVAGLSLLTDFDIDPINIVLDPNFGGYNNLIYETDDYNLLVRDETWGSVRDEIARVWENPEIYDDAALVVLSNRTGISFGIDSAPMKLVNEDLPFGGIFIVTDTTLETSGITIIDFSGGTKSRTIEFLKKYFNTDKVITDPQAVGITPTGYYEDILIEFGTDSFVTESDTDSSGTE